jgi:hypothetical protein
LRIGKGEIRGARSSKGVMRFRVRGGRKMSLSATSQVAKVVVALVCSESVSICVLSV